MLWYIRTWLNERRAKKMKYTWSCEFCGTYAKARSPELVIDGMRIHDKAIYCPKGKTNE